MVRSDLLSQGLVQVFRTFFLYHESMEEGDLDSAVQAQCRAHFVPLPSSHQATILVVVQGNSQASSTRSRAPVAAYTLERSSFWIRLELFLDGQTASPGEIKVSVPIHSELLQIKTTLNPVANHLVKGLGKVRFHVGRPRDDEKISDGAELRLRAWLEQELEKNLPKYNKLYREQFLRRLPRVGIHREELHFFSDEQAVWFTTRLKDQHLPAPPKLPDYPVILRLHPEAFNRLANRVLAGKVYNEEQLDKVAADLLAYLKLPPLPKREDTPPLLATLAQKDPLTMKIEGETISFTLRGEKFDIEDKTYPGMNVTARYRIVPRGEEWHVEREEDLEVLPADYEPGARLGARQQVTRSLLRRRLGRMLPRTIPLRAISLHDLAAQAGKLPEELSLAGTFQIGQVETAGGWLTVGWRYRPEKVPSPAP